ncbi:MAG: hypothetical protein BWY76_02086 [bacterium ADurb.Bin429]|nr:MAG: hypothetical protein BWY76_02086 [bacterium ADurb.Bin429]
MYHRWLMTVILLLFATICALAAPPVKPYEAETWTTPPNGVDAHVDAALKAQGATWRNPCSDEVFIRRVHLDLIGTMPKPDEVEEFLKNPRPDKRAALIESLFTRDEYADYWSMKWCDILRVKSEFPINLWPNAVQAYHQWIRAALRDNMPYDQFARALLTSSGSNFRVPPVNFYRAVPNRAPDGLAAATALTFMGTRLDTWPPAKREAMAAFFSKVAYKKTGEWKEEIVYLNPAMTEPVKALLPDGTTAMIPGNADPRETFANWLISPKNPWFARAIVNRQWAWTMGHGIIHEPDDLRAANPPVSPQLLAYLEAELVRARYDLRHTYRLILNSRTYQQSSITQDDEKPALRFAHYTVRRLEAEVLIDALCWIGGQGESYSSPIPEPFTFIPKGQRTIALADGSITSSFLAMFGRSSRDTGLATERNNQPSDTQRLYLLNSNDIQQRITRSPLLRDIIRKSKGNSQEVARNIYLTLLSRYPTPQELLVLQQYAKKPDMQPQSVLVDTTWALINSKEFLYRH